MAYFPFFIQLDGKKIIIVGGGRVAREKFEKLKSFTDGITLVAPDFVFDTEGYPVIRRKWEPSDLAGYDICVAATDDPEVNRKIGDICHRNGIPVNVVDDAPACDFIFPSLVKKGNVTIAISTGGASPALAQYLRRETERSLPENIGDIATLLQEIRPEVRNKVGSQEERKKIYDEVLRDLISGANSFQEEKEKVQKRISGISESLVQTACGWQEPQPEFSRSQCDFINQVPGFPECVDGVQDPAELTFRETGRDPGTSGDKTASRGKVYITGAGPSSELLTLQAMAVLERADAVVYDDLIDRTILSYSKPEADLIAVGKRLGSRKASQDEINALLIRLAQEGKNVVRLKGGDPFVFGRGAEEAGALKNAGIPFEVIPGISSGIAVPEHFGVPVTSRGSARSFSVITGHTAEKPQRCCNDNEQTGAEENRPDYGAGNVGSEGKSDRKERSNLKPSNPELSGSESSNLGVDSTELESFGTIHGSRIFLMGMTRLREISESLLEGGEDPDTPTAVMSQAFSQSEKIIRGCLKDIAEKAGEAHVGMPGILFVGENAVFDFSGTRQKSVTLTGTKQFTDRGRKILTDAGFMVKAMPHLVIRPHKENVPENFEKGSILVFTSRNGVDIFFREYREDLRSLSDVQFAVIGDATEQELRKHGFRADLKPDSFTTKALTQLLIREAGEQKVYLLRAANADSTLARELEDAGIRAENDPIYETAVRKNLLSGFIADTDYLIFGSAFGVRSFRESGASVGSAKVLCIGEKTAKEYGKECLIPEKPDLESVRDELVHYVK